MKLINMDTLMTTMEVTEGPMATYEEVPVANYEEVPVANYEEVPVEGMEEGIMGDGLEAGETAGYDGEAEENTDAITVIGGSDGPTDVYQDGELIAEYGGETASTEGIFGGNLDYVGGYNGDDSGYMGEMGGYMDEGMYDGMYDGMDGMNTETQEAFQPMSSGLFVYGIAGLSLLLGIGLGILCAVLKAKKGLKPYED